MPLRLIGPVQQLRNAFDDLYRPLVTLFTVNLTMIRNTFLTASPSKRYVIVDRPPLFSFINNCLS